MSAGPLGGTCTSCGVSCASTICRARPLQFCDETYNPCGRWNAVSDIVDIVYLTVWAYWQNYQPVSIAVGASGGSGAALLRVDADASRKLLPGMRQSRLPQQHQPAADIARRSALLHCCMQSPFFPTCIPAQGAPDYSIQQLQRVMSSHGDKLVVLSEFGWPG